jgi:Mrp family chromosome partitioning ATPase
MVVVVREEYTEKKELTHCMRQLSLSNVKVLGCVLNETTSGNGAYSKRGYKKYYKRHYRNYYYNSYYYKTPKDKDETSSKENDK